MIVASLCHDIGKAISVPNHGAIAAEMLRPYVRPDVYETIKHHQDFQGRHYYAHFDMPTNLAAAKQIDPDIFFAYPHIVYNIPKARYHEFDPYYRQLKAGKKTVWETLSTVAATRSERSM